MLPNMSKIYEKVIFAQMTEFFETSFTKCSCGFRAEYKTISSRNKMPIYPNT